MSANTNAYPDIQLDVTRFRVPGKLPSIEQPRTLDELNHRLMELQTAMGEASNLQLEYSLLHAEHIGEYKAEYDFYYAKSAGIDLDRPVWEQRKGTKRGEFGTVDEHKTYTHKHLGMKYQQMTTLERLMDLWSKRVDQLAAMITSLQTISNNLRTEESMGRMIQPRR